MSAPQVGDRVRVVLEGEVRFVAPEYFNVGDIDANSIVLAAEHVVSVEVIPKPLKVGDTIEGEQYESAPVGTVVKSRDGRHFVMKHRDGHWLCSCGQDDTGHGKRTVAFIPEATT